MRVGELEREASTTSVEAHTLATLPPLSPTPSLSNGSDGSASPSTMRSGFSSPVAEVRRRSVISIAGSEASSLPEHDDVFGVLGSGEGGMGLGLSMWEENTRLKARVCELEDVVEGVLGLVESPRL